MKRSLYPCALRPYAGAPGSKCSCRLRYEWARMVCPIGMLLPSHVFPLISRVLYLTMPHINNHRVPACSAQGSHIGVHSFQMTANWSVK